MMIFVMDAFCFFLGSLYTWEIIESSSRFKLINASPVNKTLHAVSTNGTHYTLNGTIWIGTNASQFGIDGRIHSLNVDLNLPVIMTEFGSVYIASASGQLMLIGTVAHTDTVIIANNDISQNVEILVSRQSTFNASMPLIEVFANATAISCTSLNQSCWFLQGHNVIR